MLCVPSDGLNSLFAITKKADARSRIMRPCALHNLLYGLLGPVVGEVPGPREGRGQDCKDHRGHGDHQVGCHFGPCHGDLVKTTSGFYGHCLRAKREGGFDVVVGQSH